MESSTKFIKIKYLNYGVILLIFFSIGSQIYSLINLKGFWLDEWFILYNIKFHTYSGLFNNLYYSQQFPRVYLSTVKFIAEIFNYNYFAIRVLPFSFQIVNIFLIYFLISKVVFPSDKFKALLFVLFFLSFHTTFFYFSQLKAYTADIFFTLMSVWYFYFLSKNYKSLSISSIRYLGMLFFIFSGIFLSYTFPIVFAPILIFLFLTFLSEIREHKISLKSILPMAVFIVALVLSYFTDLRFVLSDKGQYQNFSTYVMNYGNIRLFIKSLWNIAWLFTSMFFFDKAYNSYFLILLYFIKIIILIGGVTGLILVLYKYSKKTVSEKWNYIKTINFINPINIDIYLLVLFFVTIALYFLRMLPLGTHRINYFCFVFVTYFLITGVSFLLKRFKQSKYFLLPLIIFAAFFPAVQGNINELKNTNLDFDQKIYNNVGKALNAAHHYSLPVVVPYNEFYPSSIMEGQESLMIKSHHLYKPKDSIPVFVIKNNDLGNIAKGIKSDKYILINKYTYQVVNKY
jgi:hypothetical protein